MLLPIRPWFLKSHLHFKLYFLRPKPQGGKAAFALRLNVSSASLLFFPLPRAELHLFNLYKAPS